MKPSVILMAYGSPDRLSDVPAYYADIRGGRPIAPEHLDDLVARYRALGVGDGVAPSPLNAVTEETRAALEGALGLPVLTGMRHWSPRIAEAIETAVAGGADTVVGLVLAPHFSALSIGKYRALFEDALPEGIESRFVERWGADPGFVDVLADRVRGTAAHVVFTAHSLPARILAAGDPYADELLETAARVAQRAGLARPAGRSRTRASRRRASRGSGRTSSTTSRISRAAVSTPCSSVPWVSSPITWRSAGTSITRHASGPPSWVCGSSGSGCRTPTRTSSRCSPCSCVRELRLRPRTKSRLSSRPSRLHLVHVAEAAARRPTVTRALPRRRSVHTGTHCSSSSTRRRR